MAWLITYHRQKRPKYLHVTVFDQIWPPCFTCAWLCKTNLKMCPHFKWWSYRAKLYTATSAELSTAVSASLETGGQKKRQRWLITGWWTSLYWTQCITAVLCTRRRPWERYPLCWPSDLTTSCLLLTPRQVGDNTGALGTINQSIKFL